MKTKSNVILPFVGDLSYATPASIDAIRRSFEMASEKLDGSAVVLSPVERTWIRLALQDKQRMILRSRQKEAAGGDIWVLRGKELEQLRALEQRLV